MAVPIQVPAGDQAVQQRQDARALQALRDDLPVRRRGKIQGHALGLQPPQEVQDQGVKADLVVEAAGHPKAFETAFNATALGGRTVTVGLPHPQAESVIHPLLLTSEARTVVGSYLGSAVPSRDIPKYEDLWRKGELPVDELISDRIRLDDINEAMDTLAEGKAVRQIILFDED